MSKKVMNKVENLLIPQEELPYELPENWVWAKIDNISLLTDFVANGSFKALKENVTVYDQENYAYYIRLYDIKREIGHPDQKYVDITSYKFLSKSYLSGGEILVANIGSVGEVHIMPEVHKPATIAPNMILMRINKKVNNKFVYYFLKSPLGQRLIEKITTGTTQAKINKTQLKTISIPFPNINEQTRIVERLELLLNKIDEAKQLIDDIPNTIDNIKFAILNDACLGRLTSDCRKKSDSIESEVNHNSKYFWDIPKSWTVKKLKNISERVSVGHVGKTTEYYCDEIEGIPFLRSQNVRPGKLELKDVKYITKEFHGKLKKSQLQAGDLLVVRVGANRGDTCIVPEGIGSLNCANIVFARPMEGISKYLEIYFQSSIGQNILLGSSTGSAQGVINTNKVAEVEIPLPPIEEQRIIVERVDRLFNSLQKVQDDKLSLKNQLEVMRNAILTKAFRGELGTNDPAEESSIELLKEVLQEKVI